MIPLKVKEYIEGKTVLSSIPKILNLEVTNFCNLDCPMCVAKDTREQGFLDINFLKKILEENGAVFKNQFIWLHFNGESLLHPQLSKIIKILKEAGVKTRFSTNATLLTEEKSFELMKTGLDYIVFSVDGNTKRTYEKIRRGAKFEEVKNNILNFLRIKKENQFKTDTQIQIIRMKENEDEIEPFIKKWKKTDVNYINVKSFCTRAWQTKRISKFVDIPKLKKKITNRPPCFYHWETLIILWNGEVIACCQDLKGELKVGDLRKNNLMQIWNSPKLIEIRKRQINGDFSMIPCNRCPDWKGFPRNYPAYFAQSFIKLFFKKMLNRELKDEGIKIISNRK
ncbi:MAG: hypothetical protein COY73_00140 [Candidatus Nealsonbacteria bacterium CG_4_10_14_0_8_um_filter_37_14]|uniref:Radical SAM core domain-containing protein n=1 Tax=Candidatus Nealsonbacteria bacterium CG_4_10_14_0_8_um_filter_37_14 TaxID=1974684 RepID=A0A2M7R8F8_9BACT|nr:MAG: hypothetical protein COV63_00795 [Candidatus Nealsonbacteria bacterium CG11_big_fil_rev_8_21_14_0_20_37_68]PIY89697.1 MAG: hypothetical protein COY73_00140 [Candidatus Nealsonbacteria bacterium CG_4_10_14_0_8_um_filter_37_14]